MTKSEDASRPTETERDDLLKRFNNLTLKMEAALDHDDVAEVAFLLSRREEVLDRLQLVTARFPLEDEAVAALRERDDALRTRIEEAQEGLHNEAGRARATGHAARSYVKNS